VALCARQVNLYNVYGDCISGRGGQSTTHKVPFDRAELGGSAAQPGYGGPDACIDSIAGSAYFNQPSVIKAANVVQHGSHSARTLRCIRALFSRWCVRYLCVCVLQVVKQPFEWSTCGNQIHYTSTRPNLPRDTYPGLVAKLRVVRWAGHLTRPS
jgi:serine carboxypeptidase-like clade 1